MFRSSRLFVIVAVATVVLWWVAPASSQGLDEPGPNTTVESVPAPNPDAFGNGFQEHTIPAADFTPMGDAVSHYSGSGYIFRESGSNSTYWAPLMLPAGAEIEWMSAYVYDSSDTDNITFTFGAYSLPFGSQTSPHYIELKRVTSSGAVGFTHLAFTDYSTIIRYWTDLDGDGNDSATAYRLTIDLPGTTDALRFAGVMVAWHRTVSPAPATATFDDVPVGSAGFAEVEALAASGITAGCDSTHYCPSQPVTRLQMAIYLAKALGLHWMN